MPPEWCMHKSRAGRLGLIPFVLSLRVLSPVVLSLTVLSLIVLSSIVASNWLAQVVSRAEIKQHALRALQQQYMDDLSRAGKDILAIHFDYPFYLSRKLDLDQAQQQIADQSSIRFDSYNGKTVLAITGNYYAAYSAKKISPGQRARSTFLNVVMPILKAAVPRFQNNQHVQGFAVEISHHIMGKVMGVSMERPENLMVFLPRNGALKLLIAKDETARQAALLQGEVFLNAQPISIWLNDSVLPPAVDANAVSNSNSNDHADETSATVKSDPTQTGAEIVSGTNANRPLPSPTSAPLTPLKPKEPPTPRDTSTQALSALQLSNQPVVDQIVKELEPQAHFVVYAPPQFAAFRQAIYLELSLNSN